VVAQVMDPYGRHGERPPLAVGMCVQADIRGHLARDVMELPRDALHPGDVIWTVDDEDRLNFREVAVFRAESDRVLISSGLEAGERVCLSPMEAATNGMRVRVAQPDGDGADLRLSEVSEDVP
jgi:multidrug efflux pump subunit AcrA (membrane-fusion protein)